MAEEKGFEPLKPIQAHAFQACRIVHSRTPPNFAFSFLFLVLVKQLSVEL